MSLNKALKYVYFHDASLESKVVSAISFFYNHSQTAKGIIDKIPTLPDGVNIHYKIGFFESVNTGGLGIHNLFARLNIDPNFLKNNLEIGANGKAYQLDFGVALMHELIHYVNLTDDPTIAQIKSGNYLGDTVLLENKIRSDVYSDLKISKRNTYYDFIPDNTPTSYGKNDFTNGHHVDNIIVTPTKHDGRPFFPNLDFTNSKIDSDDLLIGGDLVANIFRSGGGEDFLYGYAGNDTLEGGAGADRLFGGTGNDTFKFASSDVVKGEIVNGGSLLKSEINTIDAAGSVNFRLATISNINRVAAQAASELHFSDAQVRNLVKNQTLFSGTGNVLIDANGKSQSYSFLEPQIIDLQGKIILNGRDVADNIIGTSHADVIYGQGGADTLNGRGGDDEFVFKPGDIVKGEVVNGGDGTDSLKLGAAGEINLTARTVNGKADLTFSSIEKIIGSSGNDTLIGYSNKSNVIDGGGGIDTMQGGSKNDEYFVYRKGSTISDTGGFDTIHLFGINYSDIHYNSNYAHIDWRFKAGTVEQSVNTADIENIYMPEQGGKVNLTIRPNYISVSINLSSGRDIIDLDRYLDSQDYEKQFIAFHGKFGKGDKIDISDISWGEDGHVASKYAVWTDVGDNFVKVNEAKAADEYNMFLTMFFVDYDKAPLDVFIT